MIQIQPISSIKRTHILQNIVSQVEAHMQLQVVLSFSLHAIPFQIQINLNRIGKSPILRSNNV